jgi:hypothetical protein
MKLAGEVVKEKRYSVRFVRRSRGLNNPRIVRERSRQLFFALVLQ